MQTEYNPTSSLLVLTEPGLKILKRFFGYQVASPRHMVMQEGEQAEVVRKMLRLQIMLLIYQ